MSTTELRVRAIDYSIVEWAADNQPDGQALPYLVDLVDRGLIRIIDLAWLRKVRDGTITKLELTDLDLDGNPELTIFQGAASGLRGQDDHDEAGNAIEPGCSAAMLVC